MNFKNLSKFQPENGERYIIIEDGQPQAVVLSFEDYQILKDDSFFGQDKTSWQDNDQDPFMENEEEDENGGGDKDENEEENGDFEMPEFDFDEDVSASFKDEDEDDEEEEEDFLEEDSPEVFEPMPNDHQANSREKEIADDIKLDPESKKELTLDDLPF